MPLSKKVETKLRRMVPHLYPQPATAQMPRTMELSEAEREFGLRVTDVFYAVSGSGTRAIVRRGEDPVYEPLWAYKGRPYVRIWIRSEGDHIDVFLLPKPWNPLACLQNLFSFGRKAKKKKK